MIFPVPQSLHAKGRGISPVLSVALRDMFGSEGARWEVITYAFPERRHEIDIPALADAAAFNARFPRFSEGDLSR
jgi:hypothetical protein